MRQCHFFGIAFLLGIRAANKKTANKNVVGANKGMKTANKDADSTNKGKELQISS